MMQSGTGRPLSLAGASHLVRAGIITALVVVAQVPIWMIDALVHERRMRRDTAVEEVASKWGRKQSLTGPLLMVPYRQRWTEVVAGKRVDRVDTRHATFLPEQITVDGRLDAESRRRGIFSIPVYRTQLDLRGSFARPSFASWNIPEEDVLWRQAYVALGVTDIRAIESPGAIQWGGAPVDLQPGAGEGTAGLSGVHADVPMPETGQTLDFQIPLKLKGSAGAFFAPVGRTNRVNLRSNWPSPSFQGNWLPDRHEVTREGFQASWSVSSLGRNIPQSWRDNSVPPQALEGALFGVDLLLTNDHYQLTSRSVKYAGLFLLLTFATLWLVEVLCRVRVHPIQYTLIGGAICVFYLLVLSLSEHIGFGVAYVAATGAIVAQVSAYSRVVLGTWRRAALLGATVAGLYGYLYVVLVNEDYALLIGALGVFTLLAVIMALTRRVDWFSSGDNVSAPNPASA